MKKYGIMFYYIENSVGGTLAWYTDRYEYYLGSKEGKAVPWQMAESMFN